MANSRIGLFLQDRWRQVVRFWYWITGETGRRKVRADCLARLDLYKKNQMADRFCKLAYVPEIIEVNVHGKICPALIIAYNIKTVVVQLPDGNQILRRRPKQIVRDGLLAQIRNGKKVGYEDMAGFYGNN